MNTTVPQSDLPLGDRQARILARPLVWDGRHRAAGEVVWLREEDLAALTGEGYFMDEDAVAATLATAGTALYRARVAWWRARDAARAAGYIRRA